MHGYTLYTVESVDPPLHPINHLVELISMVLPELEEISKAEKYRTLAPVLLMQRYSPDSCILENFCLISVWHAKCGGVPCKYKNVDPGCGEGGGGGDRRHRQTDTSSES
jgi:hypothetical protein